MLTLNKLMRLDEIQKEFNLPIKSRFNTNWKDYNADVYIDYTELYKSKSLDLLTYMTTEASNTTRNNDGELQLNFVKVGQNEWLFVKALVIKKHHAKVVTTDLGSTVECATVIPYEPLKDFEGKVIVSHKNVKHRFIYTMLARVFHLKVLSYTDQPYFK